MNPGFCGEKTTTKYWSNSRRKRKEKKKNQYEARFKDLKYYNKIISIKIILSKRI
jgi:hypothetical protein